MCTIIKDIPRNLRYVAIVSPLDLDCRTSYEWSIMLSLVLFLPSKDETKCFFDGLLGPHSWLLVLAKHLFLSL